MKPENTEQLARLLDQLSESYPNGIPSHLLTVATPTLIEPQTSDAAPLYHLIVVEGEGDLPAPERELLVNIATKGLKATNDSYLITYCTDGEVGRVVSESNAGQVVVFGGGPEYGFEPREGRSAVLHTYDLSTLLGNPERKKELWRALQSLL